MIGESRHDVYSIFVIGGFLIPIFVDHDVSNCVAHIGDYQFTCQEAAARIAAAEAARKGAEGKEGPNG